MTFILKDQKIQTLDFSNKEHLEFYLNLFADKNLEKDFPLFSQIIKNTQKEHEKMQGCNYKSLLQMDTAVTDEDGQPWKDGIIVNYLYRDPDTQTIHGQVTTSLVNQQHCIKTIVELKAEGKNYQVEESSFDTTHQVFSFKCNDIDPSVKIEEVEVIATVSQISEDMLLTAQALSTDSYEELNQDTPVYKISVVDPENIKTNLGDPVTIAYGRGIESGEEVDYEYYKDDYATQGKNIKLPFNAFVFLRDGCTFNGYRDFRLILDCTKGTTQYNGSYMDLFKAFDLGFQWNFDEDWCQPIDYSKVPAGEIINLNFSLTYSYSENGSNYQDSIFISGDKEDDYNSLPSFQQIPKLKFLWGCLGKDSEILMANMQRKKISDIEAGEAIRNHKGERKIVKQVLKGFEKDILSIKSQNGETILATDQHPFMTERGIKMAKDLTASDKLMLQDGTFDDVVEVYIKKYNDYAYNLTLINENSETDENQFLICNGYVAGDNHLQNNFIVDTERKVKTIPKDLK